MLNRTSLHWRRVCQTLFLPLILYSAKTASLAYSQSPQIFLDADRTQFNRTGTQQIFEGNVVAIGAGVLIAADTLVSDRRNNKLRAEGHVIMIGQTDLFTGDKLTYDIESGNFRIVNAISHSGDSQRQNDVAREILGISPQELAFEAERQERLNETADAKQQLRDEYRLQFRIGVNSDDLIERYAQLLEQEEAIKNQPNPHPLGLPPELKEDRLSRRHFWEQSRARALASGVPYVPTGYFYLSGNVIEKIDENDIRATDAFWTTCQCDEDEEPAWGFQADHIRAQIGGYADLTHAVLKIKGIPILYLPFMKIPLKSKRQSGFLTPVFSYNRKSGNIYSQPVFFDLAPNFDATFRPDFFERRGARLGLEVRYAQKKYSGWTMQLETIRDRLWLEERGTREQMSRLYREGLLAAYEEAQDVPSDEWQQLEDLESDPSLTDIEFTRQRLRHASYWRQTDPSCLRSEDERDACIEGIERRLVPPPNTWRGAYKWQGLTILAPRLSVVSAGEVWSDNRYAEDLFIPSSFSLFFGDGSAPAFTKAEAGLHLDNKDFYLGLGSHIGQSVRLTERFEGKQIPITTRLQTRIFSLDRGYSPIPIYGQLRADLIKIEEFAPPEQDDDTLHLGSGTWQRLKIDTVIPLSSNTIVSVDHFTEAEARFIAHEGLSEPGSQIKSWRTGLTFNLPIDGTARLPEALQPKQEPGELPSQRYLKHSMNWTLSLSTRPNVFHRGPYTYDTSDVYFASDGRGGSSTNAATTGESMVRQQVIDFSTSHAWQIITRAWQLSPGRTPVSDKNPPQDFRQRARQEVQSSLDKPLHDVQELYDQGTWYGNRYQQQEVEIQTPLTFSAGISYNFLVAEARRQRLKQDQIDGIETPKHKLPQPWSNLSVGMGLNLFGTSLSGSVSYNWNTRWIETTHTSLGLPTLLGIALSSSYKLTRDSPTENPETGELTARLLKERSFTLKTNIMPRISLEASIYYQRKGEDEEQYHTDLALDYQDRSGCWGLKFLRSKGFSAREQDASYLIALSIIFSDQAKALPNLATPVMREVPGQQTRYE